MNSVPGWGSWSLDPFVILALFAASVVYVRMYRLAGSRSSVGAGHWVPYAGGILALAIALLSPLDAIGDRWLISAHMLQHVMLSDIAPALIVLGCHNPNFLRYLGSDFLEHRHAWGVDAVVIGQDYTIKHGVISSVVRATLFARCRLPRPGAGGGCTDHGIRSASVPMKGVNDHADH